MKFYISSLSSRVLVVCPATFDKRQGVFTYDLEKSEKYKLREIVKHIPGRDFNSDRLYVQSRVNQLKRYMSDHNTKIVGFPTGDLLRRLSDLVDADLCVKRTFDRRRNAADAVNTIWQPADYTDAWGGNEKPGKPSGFSAPRKPTPKLPPGAQTTPAANQHLGKSACQKMPVVKPSADHKSLDKPCVQKPSAPSDAGWRLVVKGKKNASIPVQSKTARKASSKPATVKPSAGSKPSEKLTVQPTPPMNAAQKCCGVAIESAPVVPRVVDICSKPIAAANNTITLDDTVWPLLSRTTCSTAHIPLSFAAVTANVLTPTTVCHGPTQLPQTLSSKTFTLADFVVSKPRTNALEEVAKVNEKEEEWTTDLPIGWPAAPAPEVPGFSSAFCPIPGFWEQIQLATNVQQSTSPPTVVRTFAEVCSHSTTNHRSSKFGIPNTIQSNLSSSSAIKNLPETTPIRRFSKSPQSEHLLSNARRTQHKLAKKNSRQRRRLSLMRSTLATKLSQLEQQLYRCSFSESGLQREMAAFRIWWHAYALPSFAKNKISKRIKRQSRQNGFTQAKLSIREFVASATSSPHCNIFTEDQSLYCLSRSVCSPIEVARADHRNLHSPMTFSDEEVFYDVLSEDEYEVELPRDDERFNTQQQQHQFLLSLYDSGIRDFDVALTAMQKQFNLTTQERWSKGRTFKNWWTAFSVGSRTLPKRGAPRRIEITSQTSSIIPETPQSPFSPLAKRAFVTPSPESEQYETEQPNDPGNETEHVVEDSGDHGVLGTTTQDITNEIGADAYGDVQSEQVRVQGKYGTKYRCAICKGPIHEELGYALLNCKHMVHWDTPFADMFQTNPRAKCPNDTIKTRIQRTFCIRCKKELGIGVYETACKCFDQILPSSDKIHADELEQSLTASNGICTRCNSRHPGFCIKCQKLFTASDLPFSKVFLKCCNSYIHQTCWQKSGSLNLCPGQCGEPWKDPVTLPYIKTCRPVDPTQTARKLLLNTEGIPNRGRIGGRPLSRAPPTTQSTQTIVSEDSDAETLATDFTGLTASQIAMPPPQLIPPLPTRRSSRISRTPTPFDASQTAPQLPQFAKVTDQCHTRNSSHFGVGCGAASAKPNLQTQLLNRSEIIM